MRMSNEVELVALAQLSESELVNVFHRKNSEGLTRTANYKEIVFPNSNQPKYIPVVPSRLLEPSLVNSKNPQF